MLLSIPDCDEASDAAETDLAPSPVLPPGVPAQPPTKAATYLHPAFAQRVEGEIPFLRRAARRWRPHPADADDLVQETLLRALANAHLWQAGSDLRGWLFTIMRNQFFAVITQSNRSSRALEAIAGSRSGSRAGPARDAADIARCPRGARPPAAQAARRRAAGRHRGQVVRRGRADHGHLGQRHPLSSGARPRPAARRGACRRDEAALRPPPCRHAAGGDVSDPARDSGSPRLRRRRLSGTAAGGPASSTCRLRARLLLEWGSSSTVECRGRRATGWCRCWSGWAYM